MTASQPSDDQTTPGVTVYQVLKALKFPADVSRPDAKQIGIRVSEAFAQTTGLSEVESQPKIISQEEQIYTNGKLRNVTFRVRTYPEWFRPMIEHHIKQHYEEKESKEKSKNNSPDETDSEQKYPRKK